ncbi:hypothetical protein O0L34_g1624 [Tuta absoluta]|nr:hypothetical protein O0L34_g1624 [Tuta absoluta]
MRDEMEIHNVPEQNSENLNHLVLLIAKKYGVDLNDQDLNGMWRVGLAQPKDPTSRRSISWRPRPIVVKFVRRAKRDEMIKAAKARRNTTTENLVPGPPQTMAIYERLTKKNRLLFRATTSRIKQYNYTYRWIHNGCLYVRKADRSPAILIRSLDELDAKVGIDKIGQSSY